ncbi:unnamed protein product, partial [Owenia fusiformis]
EGWKSKYAGTEFKVRIRFDEAGQVKIKLLGPKNKRQKQKKMGSSLHVMQSPMGFGRRTHMLVILPRSVAMLWRGGEHFVSEIAQEEKAQQVRSGNLPIAPARPAN